MPRNVEAKRSSGVPSVQRIQLRIARLQVSPMAPEWYDKVSAYDKSMTCQ